MKDLRAMSSKSKKGKSVGVRYTPEQKKEIVEFVQQYNEANGRGGQSAAVSKFKVTPITIGAWLKAAGVSKKKGKPAKAAKAAKPAKAKKKAAKKAKGGAKKGSKGAGKRYSAAEKQEVIDFVNSYNASNGRGGQSEAARKFNISILTVSAWLKKSGNKVAKTGKAVAAGKSSAKVPSALTAKVASLIQMSDRIQKAELELAKLRAGYESLKSSIKAVI
jgi:transposase-like protein